MRVLDLLIITKDAGGEVDAFELHEFEDGGAGALRELGAEFTQLLSEEDVGHIAAALEPGHRGRGARLGEHVGAAVRRLGARGAPGPGVRPGRGVGAPGVGARPGRGPGGLGPGR